MGVVRDLTRQVVRPSPIARELLIQMAVIAFAIGMVLAGVVESSHSDHEAWNLLMAALLTALLYLYGWTSWIWYTFLE